MLIAAIVATDLNNAIGKNNQLLWHLPADMKFFKEKTTGHVVITGRKNYESIPEKYRPLPNRTNIVITRNVNYQAPGAIVVQNLEEAINKAKQLNTETVFIIGGGEIYKLALPKAEIIYRTLVFGEWEADTFFPEINPDVFQKTEEIHHLKDEKNPYDYSFQTYRRIS